MVYECNSIQTNDNNIQYVPHKLRSVLYLQSTYSSNMVLCSFPMVLLI
jgi:hypothetical protein